MSRRANSCRVASDKGKIARLVRRIRIAICRYKRALARALARARDASETPAYNILVSRVNGLDGSFFISLRQFKRTDVSLLPARYPTRSGRQHVSFVRLRFARPYRRARGSRLSSSRLPPLPRCTVAPSRSLSLSFVSPIIILPPSGALLSSGPRFSSHSMNSTSFCHRRNCNSAILRPSTRPFKRLSFPLTSFRRALLAAVNEISF